MFLALGPPFLLLLNATLRPVTTTYDIGTILVAFVARAFPVFAVCKTLQGLLEGNTSSFIDLKWYK
jgi:hypothetical protein